MCVKVSLLPQCPIYLLEMFQSKPLHLYYLIVARSVIEWVTSLREIVQYISRVKNRYQTAIHPGYAKEIVWNLHEKFILKC